MSASSPLPTPERPYVGVRPFERVERSIFFGRERDALYLCSKIFSTRLTLLYAPSGAGKSSILRTLVIPELESQHARTLYFDSWNAGDPLEALREELVAMATAGGVAEAGAGAPSLAELVSMLNSVDDRTVVLVLDQFEELLTPAHGARLDRFRRELRRLVSSGGPDVRVVLSLREEHLAALEPFREDILELFRSTYRLEMLGDTDLRKAIQGPAAVFGVEWEPKLVEDLINDLRSTGGGAVELPMLQLVCDQLWAARRSEPRLTVSLYEWLGRVPAILDGYVRSVMPSTVQGQLLTAKLMVVLAPRSGFKVAFTPGHLAETCALPRDWVSQELERLAEQRILRTRRYRSEVLYELQHDALIPIIGQWRDEVMERHRQRRAARRSRRRRVMVLLLALLAVVGRAAWGPIRIYQRTNWPLAELDEKVRKQVGAVSPVRPEDVQKQFFQDDELREEAGRTFDEVARVVYDEHDWLGGDILPRQLEQYRGLIPPGYGPGTADSPPIDMSGASWPIVAEVPAALKIDRDAFNDAWRSIARPLVEEGLPVPQEIELLPNGDFPRTFAQVWAAGIGTALPLPAHDQDLLIPEGGLSQELKTFLGRVRPGEPIGTAKDGGPWRLVPFWSLPVWKVSGTPAYDGNALAALLIMLEIRKAPDQFLSPTAVEFLLRRAERVFPATADEARNARGAALVTDLQYVVKRGGSLRHIERLLDQAAEYPTLSSAELASILVPDPGDDPPPPPVFGRAREAATGARARLSPWQDQQLKGFERSTGWLPPLKRTVTCFIGAELHAALLKDGRVDRAVEERVSQVQGQVYRRFGVRIPDLEFVPSPSIPPNAFQLELPDESEAGGRLMFVTRGAPAEEVVNAYRWRAEALRERWVTAETVSNTLRTLSPDMRGWFANNYSVTALKEVLRSVVRPCPHELQQRMSQADGSQVEVTPNSTIYPLDWLLGSLVFWSLAPGRDLDGLTENLQQTQQALDDAWRAPLSDDDDAPREIVRGVVALERGQPGWAQHMFEEARARYPDSAAQWFLQVYAQHRVQWVARAIQRACANPLAPRLTADARVELEDYLDSLAQGTSSKEDERRIRLCQFSAAQRDRPAERRRLGATLAQAFADPEAWPAAEAAAFGRELLAIADPVAREKPLQEKSRKLMLSAFDRASSGEAEAMFGRTLEQCHRPGPHYACQDLLVRMADQRPEPAILFDWLMERSAGETEEELEDALVLADRVDRRLYDFPDFDPLADRVSFARARAQLRLADLGHEEYRAPGEQTAQSLAQKLSVGGKAQALLVRSATATGDYDKANELLTAGLKEWRHEPDLRLAQLSLSIKSGRLDEAFQPGEDGVVGAATGEEMDGQCLSSMAQVVARKQGWKLNATRMIGSKNPCRRLLTLLLYARLGAKTGKDQHVLDDAWSQINRASWPERLRGGDASVWYEMLVGYYTGEVKREEIFGPLRNDKAFADSKLQFLRRPRRWLSCEAHFYEALLADTQGEEGLKQAALGQLKSPDCRSRIEQGLGMYLMAAREGTLTRPTPLSP